MLKTAVSKNLSDPGAQCPQMELAQRRRHSQSSCSGKGHWMRKPHCGSLDAHDHGAG